LNSEERERGKEDRSHVTIQHGGTPPARLELWSQEIEVLMMVAVTRGLVSGA
jgi:hypothetical protein